MKSKSSSRLNAARPTTKRLKPIPIGVAPKIERDADAEQAEHHRDQVEQAEGAGRHDDARPEPLGDPDRPAAVEEEHDQKVPTVSITACRAMPG